ncbi:MAG: DUF3293 domain-containing protein [Xanthomonadales bacterium]|nr:DUF3293 domain-containing protein [Xanthomonadales bacterium]
MASVEMTKGKQSSVSVPACRARGVQEIGNRQWSTTAGDSAASSGTLCQAYLEAPYRILLPRAMLQVVPGRLAGNVERRIPRCFRFSLLTACNPGGILQSTRRNHAANRALLSWLQRQALPHWPAVNGTRQWREPSWLVGGLWPWQLRRLADALGQLATLHWQRGDPVSLVWHRAAGIEPPTRHESECPWASTRCIAASFEDAHPAAGSRRLRLPSSA